jgi:hypothetical protein
MVPLEAKRLPLSMMLSRAGWKSRKNMAIPFPNLAIAPQSTPDRLHLSHLLVLALASTLVACGSPAAQTESANGAQQAAAANTPLASPDVTGARWVASTNPQRILYGKPGEPAFIALACEQNGPQPHLRLTRFAPAPEGGKAIFAVDGNGYIARWKADAASAGDGYDWQSIVGLEDYKLNALLGPRSIEATVPGAGTVIINQNELPRQLIEQCRSFIAPPLAAARSLRPNR